MEDDKERGHGDSAIIIIIFFYLLFCFVSCWFPLSFPMAWAKDHSTERHWKSQRWLFLSANNTMFQSGWNCNMNQSRQLESTHAACSLHALKGLPCPQDVSGHPKVTALGVEPGEEQRPPGDTPKAFAHPMGIYEKSSWWTNFLKVGNLLGAVIDDNSPFGAHGESQSHAHSKHPEPSLQEWCCSLSISTKAAADLLF